MKRKKAEKLLTRIHRAYAMRNKMSPLKAAWIRGITSALATALREEHIQEKGALALLRHFRLDHTELRIAFAWSGATESSELLLLEAMLTRQNEASRKRPT